MTKHLTLLLFSLILCLACDTGTDVTVVGDGPGDVGNEQDPTPGNDCGNVGLGTIEVVDYDSKLPVILDYIIVEDEVYVPGSKNDVNEVNVSDIVFCTVDYTLIIDVDGYRSVNWTDFTFNPGVTTINMLPQNPFTTTDNPVWLWRCYDILGASDCEQLTVPEGEPARFDLCMELWGGGPCCTIFRDNTGVYLFPVECLG